MRDRVIRCWSNGASFKPKATHLTEKAHEMPIGVVQVPMDCVSSCSNHVRTTDVNPSITAVSFYHRNEARRGTSAYFPFASKHCSSQLEQTIYSSNSLVFIAAAAAVVVVCALALATKKAKSQPIYPLFETLQL
jgi:hypothetical protein